MTAPTLTVGVTFPPTVLNDTTHFVLDHATRGKLDGVTYTLGSTVATDITSTVQKVSIRRGRTRTLDKFEAGSATVVLRDLTGVWNPQNTSGTFYPYLQPRRPITITAVLNGVTYSLFTGFVQRYSFDYEPTNQVTWVTLECSDLMALMQQVKITTVAGATPDEYGGARVQKIMTQAGAPFSTTAVSYTASSGYKMQADPGTERTVLDAVNTIVDSDWGAFFIDDDGTPVYIDEGTLWSLTNRSYATFSDTASASLFSTTLGFVIPIVGSTGMGGDVSFTDIRVGLDDTTLYNDVTVTPAGFTGENYTDPDSINLYGRKNLEIDTLTNTTAAANQAARIIVRTKKAPAVHASMVELDTYSGGDAAYWALSLKLLRGITVYHSMSGTTMQWGAGVGTTTYGSAGLAVYGIEHDITPQSWRTRLQLDVPIDDPYVLAPV